MHSLTAVPALFLAVLLQMQPGQTGRIRVEVPPPFEGALKSVQVILRNTNGWMAVPFEHIGDFGAIEFDRLAVGSYEVSVNADGYEPVRLPVGLGDMSRTVVVTVTLKARPRDATVDTAELGRQYPRRAIQDYEKAVEENRKGNTERALVLLEAVVALAPDYYPAQNTLGTLYQKVNRYVDAEEAYHRARDLRPKSDEPLINLGSLYVQEAAARSAEGPGVVSPILNDARQVLGRALDIRHSAMAYYLRGTALFRSGLYEEGENHLNQALVIEPRMPAARLMLANLHIRQQNWKNALSQLEAYLSENPKAPDRVQIQETRAKVAERVQ